YWISNFFIAVFIVSSFLHPPVSQSRNFPPSKKGDLQPEYNFHRIFSSEEHFGWVLAHFFHLYQKPYGFTAVNDSVIIGECDVHHGADFHFPIHSDGPLN